MQKMDLFFMVVVASVAASLPGIHALKCYTCESHQGRGETFGITPTPDSVMVHHDCHLGTVLRKSDPEPLATCPDDGNFVCVSAHLPYGRNMQYSVRGCYDPAQDTQHSNTLCDANNAECCSQDRCNAETSSSSGATRWLLSGAALLVGIALSLSSAFSL